ncbi:MAG TPA: hypothetical protein VMS71_02375, partial [Candidatus Acidoferrum sp.]|nr:hypothetical protein [Candidatus Acidoferrum sp.]
MNAPAQTADSVKSSAVHVSDSTIVAKDTTKPADTLSAAQKAMQSFEQRYKEMKKVEEEQKARFSFYDTLLACFGSPRLNQRALLDQSFYHDAGDYFKFDPSYFVTDYSQTPMRKTVQPFGLSGDRLNVVTNGVPTHPFEHVVEPDGLIDMNDIETGLDHDVYTLPGAVGMLFGGSEAIASLVTESYFDTTLDAHSSFLVDKGWDGFANTRGRYSKRFTRGKTIDVAIGY